MRTESRSASDKAGFLPPTKERIVKLHPLVKPVNDLPEPDRSQVKSLLMYAETDHPESIEMLPMHVVLSHNGVAYAITYDDLYEALLGTVNIPESLLSEVEQ